MALRKYRLGDLIEQRREKNPGLKCVVKGVTRDGFITPKVPDADTRLYNVFYKNDFVFNPARMEINSIALNTDYEVGICSSLYEVFYVSRQDILNPKYLRLLVKREEFARLCGYIGWGSAREYCRVGCIAEIELELPPIEVQRKYVAVYEAMLENQRSYERGLEDLKLTCDGYIEKLMRECKHERIAPYVIESDTRNGGSFGLGSVRGISVLKKFIPTKAKMDGVNLSGYKTVEPRQLSFVTVTSRNSDKITIALNESHDTYLVSATYVVFGCVEEKLLPEYLMLFFSRGEFDRYARFHSWGSARETFSWVDLQDVEIPIPDIKTQRAIADIYKVYRQRSEINERLKTQLKDICPILIKGSIDEARAS